jgi:phage gp29-like protein
VRLELTKGDADLLSDTLNDGLVRWIVDLNLPGYAATGLPYPGVWWDVSEPEDLAARADRDTKLHGMGFDPTDDYVRDTYGEGWVRRQPARPPVPPGAAGDLAALFAEAGRASRARLAGAVPEVALAEQAGAEARQHTDRWLDRIAEVVARAKTLEEIAAELLRLYPQLETEGLAEAMAQALAVAQLTGRAEIADGLG